MHGGCGYVEWHDPELPNFFSDLIGDLKHEVWRLRGLGSAARGDDECPVLANAGHEEAISNAIEALQVQLKEKDAEIEALKGKYMNVVMICIVFVLGLVVGKMAVY
ncbi:hypothetical protein D1007_45871 [Hordeum vulgare]|nr:hypothetical protein D1007_45871 [Hordeum vulgare]